MHTCYVPWLSYYEEDKDRSIKVYPIDNICKARAENLQKEPLLGIWQRGTCLQSLT